MLDSIFNKGFKAAKCKTLLKLTIPRIKLLRNRREIQLKQMRKAIANLLENGQEATARIRIEHIIREENMMAAQEIIELFCELIAIRLPIIELQRECPLDLKEAISSICFAAPRCSDLPELLQVQMSFAAKYGREFVTAASELMPNCGVNRQIIQLLSVQAPSMEIKLKLLKDIAEEHEVDWDPASTEAEFFKPHEDLLNGPNQTSSSPVLPLPKEKHMDSFKNSTSEESELDFGFDSWNLPEVPKDPVQSNTDSPRPSAGNLQSPPPPPFYSHDEQEEPKTIPTNYYTAETRSENLNPKLTSGESQQFIPFATPPPPPLPPAPSTSPPSAFQVDSSPPHSQIKSDARQEDLQDVLVAAQAAADSAERAAAAARAAASLTRVRITELSAKKKSQDVYHGIYHETSDEENLTWNPDSMRENMSHAFLSDSSSKEKVADFSDYTDVAPEYDAAGPRPQRSVSMEDDPYFSYPNLFSRQESNLMARFDSPEKSRPAHDGA